MKLLIATDVAARGLDIPDVEVHFPPPSRLLLQQIAVCIRSASRGLLRWSGVDR